MQSSKDKAQSVVLEIERERDYGNKGIVLILQEAFNEYGAKLKICREALEFYSEGWNETCGRPQPWQEGKKVPIEEERLGCGCCAKNSGERARRALEALKGDV